MGLWTVRFFRSIFPTIFTLLALVVMALIMLSGLKRDPFLDKFYLFKIDARNIYAHQALEREEGLTYAQAIGLSNYYYFYFFQHCQADRNLRKLKCKDARIDYHFDPRKMLKENLFSEAVVKLPRGTGTFTKRVRISSICMTVFYLAGVLFSLLTLLTVIIISISGTGILFASILAGYAAFAFLGGSGIMSIMYFLVKKSIRDKAGYLKLKTEQGQYALIISWSGTLISFIAFVFLLLATRFSRKKSKETEKLYQ